MSAIAKDDLRNWLDIQIMFWKRMIDTGGDEWAKSRLDCYQYTRACLIGEAMHWPDIMYPKQVGYDPAKIRAWMVENG